MGFRLHSGTALDPYGFVEMTRLSYNSGGAHEWSVDWRAPLDDKTAVAALRNLADVIDAHLKGTSP